MSLELLLVGSLVLVTVVLVLLPVGALLYGSLSTAPLGERGQLTLNNYARAFSNPSIPAVIQNTLVFALGQAAFGC